MTTGREQTIVHFDAAGIMLEGIWTPGSHGCAAVITHPHPLYGGDMHNPVVEAMEAGYRSRRWGALRFNFRGTGGSQGSFDNGNGEQADIRAAIDHLRRHGAERIELAGYSFGAWVLARWANANTGHGHRLRFVAPPVAFMSFKDIHCIRGLVQVIAGGRDEIAPATAIASLLETWSPSARLHIIDNADHFFFHHLDRITAHLSDPLDNPARDAGYLQTS